MFRTPLRLVAALVLALLAATAAPLLAGSQDFTLVNKTGLVVVELYVAPSSSDDWEEDVLGVDVLESGASVDIEFSPKTKAALWDLRIVDEDGDEVVWQELDLKQISKVTLRYDGKGNPIADLE